VGRDGFYPYLILNSVLIAITAGENWKTRVQSTIMAKYLTPRFALINHFYEMIIRAIIGLIVVHILDQNFLFYSFIHIFQ